MEAQRWHRRRRGRVWGRGAWARDVARRAGAATSDRGAGPRVQKCRGCPFRLLSPPDPGILRRLGVRLIAVVHTATDARAVERLRKGRGRGARARATHAPQVRANGLHRQQAAHLLGEGGKHLASIHALPCRHKGGEALDDHIGSGTTAPLCSQHQRLKCDPIVPAEGCNALALASPGGIRSYGGLGIRPGPDGTALLTATIDDFNVKRNRFKGGSGSLGGRAALPGHTYKNIGRATELNKQPLVHEDASPLKLRGYLSPPGKFVHQVAHPIVSPHDLTAGGAGLAMHPPSVAGRPTDAALTRIPHCEGNAKPKGQRQPKLGVGEGGLR
jgi:hypothetical protein